MLKIMQVRLTGFGGQGIVLAGMLLGEAGAIEGRSVAGSNSYGAQARGSACRSEIIFSEGPIDYPHLTTADILVAMSQGSYDICCRDVREPSGLILYDQGQVKPKTREKVTQRAIPATEYAIQQLKNKQVANIILLGALIEITKIVSPRAMKKAIQRKVHERFQALNLDAFYIGLQLGRKAHG